MANDVCPHVFTDELPSESCIHPSPLRLGRGVMGLVFVQFIQGTVLQNCILFYFHGSFMQTCKEMERQKQWHKITHPPLASSCVQTNVCLNAVKVYKHIASSVCPVAIVCVQTNQMKVIPHHLLWMGGWMDGDTLHHPFAQWLSCVDGCVWMER